MKKNIFILLINLVLSLFQSSFLPIIVGVSATPNLVFSTSFAYLLNNKMDLALFSVFFGGLFYDAFSGRTLGVSSLLGTSLIYGLHLLRSYFFRGKRFLFVVAIFLFYLTQMILVNQFDVSFDIFISGVVTGLLGVLLSKLLASV